MRVVGFDSKLIRREKPSFKALLGIGVTINDYDKLVKIYNETVDKIFKECGIQRKKGIYKGTELTEIFYGSGVEILPLIVEKIIPSLDYVDIYYTYFEPNSTDDRTGKPLTMGVFFEEEIKRMNPVEFIDLLRGPYPAICCYAYLKQLKTEVNSVYYIDDCSKLNPSKATTGVITHSKTKFLFKGDKVNFAISCADIICRYVDDVCLKTGLHLNKNLIENLNLNPKYSQTTCIGQKWLSEIKPSRNISLNINHKYPHPIFCFFVDSYVFNKESKSVMEKSNLFRYALDKASQLGGSVKFFEPSDQELFTEEDFLVTHNEHSKLKTTELKNLGCEAKIVDISYF
mgnify:CR=1 FL=1|tara:strand:+ start:4598 stop:5626 length:1029 start_codon:yes stop_codon:yes gene_type:complete